LYFALRLALSDPPVKADAAGFQPDNATGIMVDQLKIVCDQQDGDALFVERGQEVHEAL
jgi:hypothetical protein